MDYWYLLRQVLLREWDVVQIAHRLLRKCSLSVGDWVRLRVHKSLKPQHCCKILGYAELRNIFLGRLIITGWLA